MKSKSPLVLTWLLSIPALAWAQTVPSAGSQIQQIPAAPQPPRPAATLPLAPAAESSGETGEKGPQIEVRQLHLTGVHAYSEAALLSAINWKVPQTLTLAQLRAWADRITHYYRAHGYFLAQTYLPQQDIRDGVVTLTVLEGHYDQLAVRNQSRLHDRVPQALLQGLTTGDPVTLAPLERRLLLLSDLPGVQVKSTLTPGASVGTSDLIVDVDPGQTVTGSVEADNQGSRYTGQERLGATVNLNNLAGWGDVLSVRALSSGRRLNYARLAYQGQAGVFRLGASYADMNYALGREFAYLDAHGGTQITSVFGAYPWLRSRDRNVSIQVSYDDKSFHDVQDSVGLIADKSAHVWTATFLGDARDAWLQGGVNRYAVTVTQGHLSAPLTEAHSDGGYSKLSWTLNRVQAISSATSVQVSLSGQVASKNLDSSEKMELGGAQAVRAYPQGELYGDQGYLASIEARWLLPRLTDKQPGQVQAVSFIDSGTAFVNKSPWDASDNRRTLSGIGVGVNWIGHNDLVVKAFVAHRIGAAKATSAPDAGARFWIQAVQYF
ncbi:MAG TPA: ShlB/FhaC/HecB family hemolysin secretion/activation protein [Aquabacterium sp.]|nr:ShlB/FhaC/HecB family hemolysin secretion/activation protein [Aquabacterium sp.]